MLRRIYEISNAIADNVKSAASLPNSCNRQYNALQVADFMLATELLIS